MTDRSRPIGCRLTEGEPDDVRAGYDPFTLPPVTVVDVHRAAEAWFRPVESRMAGEDAAAFDATLRADPGSYRVLRVGPFEYVQGVQPCPRVLSLEIGDRLAAASPLPVFVEGSQSPLSVKPPHAGADVDVLVAVSARDDLARASDRLSTGHFFVSTVVLLKASPKFVVAPGRCDHPGQIPRNFKMLKRQMYGRARFDLLRKRVLYGD